VCDDVDDCVGTLDALGVCGGSCAADADADGVCDDVDDCVGTLDALGVCGGSCAADNNSNGICDDEEAPAVPATCPEPPPTDPVQYINAQCCQCL